MSPMIAAGISRPIWTVPCQAVSSAQASASSSRLPARVSAQSAWSTCGAAPEVLGVQRLPPTDPDHAGGRADDVLSQGAEVPLARTASAPTSRVGGSERSMSAAVAAACRSWSSCLSFRWSSLDPPTGRSGRVLNNRDSASSLGRSWAEPTSSRASSTRPTPPAHFDYRSHPAPDRWRLRLQLLDRHLGSDRAVRGPGAAARRVSTCRVTNTEADVTGLVSSRYDRRLRAAGTRSGRGSGRPVPAVPDRARSPALTDTHRPIAEVLGRDTSTLAQQVAGTDDLERPGRLLAEFLAADLPAPDPVAARLASGGRARSCAGRTSSGSPRSPSWPESSVRTAAAAVRLLRRCPAEVGHRPTPAAERGRRRGGRRPIRTGRPSRPSWASPTRRT